MVETANLDKLKIIKRWVHKVIPGAMPSKPTEQQIFKEEKAEAERAVAVMSHFRDMDFFIIKTCKMSLDRRLYL